MKLEVGAAIMAAVLSGCASRQPQLSPSQLDELSRPVTCSGAERCGKLWRRVQIWVAENAGYKIQVATDAVIETYSAPAYATSWAMRATRVPREGDLEEVKIEFSCGQVPLCSPPRDRMELRFKRDLTK